MSKRLLEGDEIARELVRLVGMDPDTPVRYIKVECSMDSLPECTVTFLPYREEPDQAEAPPRRKQYKTLDDPQGTAGDKDTL